jgi:hypothetical protein
MWWENIKWSTTTWWRATEKAKRHWILLTSRSTSSNGATTKKTKRITTTRKQRMQKTKLRYRRKVKCLRLSHRWPRIGRKLVLTCGVAWKVTDGGRGSVKAKNRRRVELSLSSTIPWPSACAPISCRTPSFYTFWKSQRRLKRSRMRWNDRWNLLKSTFRKSWRNAWRKSKKSLQRFERSMPPPRRNNNCKNNMQ